MESDHLLVENFSQVWKPYAQVMQTIPGEAKRCMILFIVFVRSYQTNILCNICYGSKMDIGIIYVECGFIYMAF